MPKFNVQICPVCEGNKFSTFLTTTDFFVSGEEFRIKKCESCGLGITEDIEDENNIGSYYKSENYISHSNTAVGFVNSIYHKIRKYMLGQKRKLVEKVTGLKSGRILDVGAGTGFFLNEMKNHGWKISGTEKSPEARNFAKTEHGLELKDTDKLFQISNESYDIITLWHVLEHIHRLDKNLETFARLLTKNGKLLIAVPNYTSYDATHYKKFWAAWDVPRHIWHFSPKQINKLGAKHGFKLTSVRAMPFDSFYISLISEKYKKSVLSLPKGIFYGTVSWMTSVFKPGRCSSVIYVFEK